MKLLGIVALFASLAVPAFAASSSSSTPPAKQARQSSKGTSDIARCTQRGIQYFKDIGSYPTLSSPPNTGRRAEDVAFERCSRTLTAF